MVFIKKEEDKFRKLEVKLTIKTTLKVKSLSVIKVGHPFGIFVHGLMDSLVASWTEHDSLDRDIGPSGQVRRP